MGRPQKEPEPKGLPIDLVVKTEMKAVMGARDYKKPNSANIVTRQQYASYAGLSIYSTFDDPDVAKVLKIVPPEGIKTIILEQKILDAFKKCDSKERGGNGDGCISPSEYDKFSPFNLSPSKATETPAKKVR